VLRTPDALDDFTVAPLNCALAQVIYAFTRPGSSPVRPWSSRGRRARSLRDGRRARARGGAHSSSSTGSRALKLARAFGADHVLNVDDFATSDARAKAVRDLTGAAATSSSSSSATRALVEGIAMTRAEAATS